MSDFSPESLPNRFDFADAQPRIYAAWEAARVFHAEPPADVTKDTSKGPYSIVIPPPNVTGALHLGHALNNTLQDIQIRLHRMQGYNVCWMPGTDHAGIATQAVVEKRLREEEKKTRHDLGREKLVERIWEWKEQYEARILSQLKRMGASCDWDRTRFTLDEGCSRAVRQTFFDLFSKGLIYRGKRLVNWDTFLQTAVSDDEVFQETVKGKFWHFRYPVISPKAGEPSHVTIATTRPETMLGDTAVAVHPEPAKALDKAEAELRERLEKAAAKEKEPIQAQIDNVQERRKTMLPQLELLVKMARDGRKLMLPLVNREIPLIADEWAKPEMGSGCVKITPAHDPNDYLVGQRQKLPMINILNPDGTLNSEAGAYKGLTIAKAREKVVADLDALGLLGDVEDRDIELPHSDRSKTPIEPYLADQWFVRMGDIEDIVLSEGKAIDNGIRPGLAQTAMDAVTSGRVKILPERYAKSYLDWLGEKRDWPVSRQLWWGHRIPIWTKPFRGMDQKNEIEKLAIKLLPNGCDEHANFYMQWDPDTIEGNAFICLAADDSELVSSIETAGFVHDPDVLDTWFSSALWPHSTFGWPEKTAALDYWYPTSVLITSRDIITLWVARMVLTGLNNMGEIPFREVFIHPKILDGYGETMSKSKGNGVDPIDVIDKFGADALRYGLASLCTETQDVRMPVQFECPHCEALIDQTKKNRELPKIPCSKCGKEFSTQWARTDADKALPRGSVVSERFEVSRNFTNKLWNAARFALINLQDFNTLPSGESVLDSSLPLPSGERAGVRGELPNDPIRTPAPHPNPLPAAGRGNSVVSENDLTVEDRWLLSRLATVTAETTTALENYHYADAAKSLYDFAWDEFCSFYIEMAKPRLADPAQKQHAQRLLAHSLDVLLRLLHPMMPFITEDIWQHLNKLAPERGLTVKPQAAASQLIQAPWPVANLADQNKTIESQFAIFQQALSALREIRSRQNIATRNELEFCVKCDAATARLLEPMAPYFHSMANAKATGWGEDTQPPATHAKAALAGLEIFVDLKDFIDVKAEIAKNEKEEQRLAGLVKSKEAKLASENFVARAPANVVQAERDSLAQAQEQLASVRASLESLRRAKP